MKCIRIGDLTVAKKYVLLLGQMISQFHSHLVMVHLLKYVNLVPTLLTSHLTGIAALLMMPPAIPNEIRERTIKQWLSGDTRAKIASDNSIGEGSVTNIVSDFNKGLADSEFGSIKEFVVESRKHGLTLSNLGPSLRLYNHITKLGANQEQIESLVINLVTSPEPEKMIDVENQVAQLSRSKSIPLEDLENHVKQEEEEKKRLEEEIKQRRSTLESTNVEIQTTNEYTQLKARLSKYHLSSEDPKKLVTVLDNIKHYRYDPKKIVAVFSNVKSLKRRKHCKIIVKSSKNEYQKIDKYYRS
jgi:hypothetical protein